jgi:MoxR-like ATPase
LTDQRLSSPSEVSARAEAIRREIRKRIFGLDEPIELLLAAIVAGRHVLLEGVPGLGKTLLMKTLSTAMGCAFRRIQFTPDLLPADILGGYVYDGRDGSFSLRKGPIFANVILADEINRAPAKTQSALLEVMQERQVTIEGETHEVPRPFIVFATQNPLEHEGVYPLPQAQLDRFGLRILLEHPAPEEESRSLGACREPDPGIDAVWSPDDVIALERAAEGVTVSDRIVTLLVTLANSTRAHEGVALGASPRVGVDLVHLARARALLNGRGHVLPDDVKALFPHATNHRLLLTPQAEIGGTTVFDVIRETIENTRFH